MRGMGRVGAHATPSAWDLIPAAPRGIKIHTHEDLGCECSLLFFWFWWYWLFCTLFWGRWNFTFCLAKLSLDSYEDEWEGGLWGSLTVRVRPSLNAHLRHNGTPFLLHCALPLQPRGSPHATLEECKLFWGTICSGLLGFPVSRLEWRKAIENP